MLREYNRNLIQINLTSYFSSLIKLDTHSARTEKCVCFFEVARTRRKLVLARTVHTSRETQEQNSWEVLMGLLPVLINHSHYRFLTSHTIVVEHYARKKVLLR